MLFEKGWDCNGRGGKLGDREAPEGGDICIHIADVVCCAAEINTTL